MFLRTFGRRRPRTPCNTYIYTTTLTLNLACNTPGVYIQLDNEYGFNHVISVNKTVGAKAKTPPFARGLRRPRCTNEDKTTGRLTLRLIRHRTKTCDEVISSCDPVQHGGPRVIRPIVIGPAWPSRVTGLICKGLPVITVCNPALWEYSGDNLGV
jgi:hypothetical protein